MARREFEAGFVIGWRREIDVRVVFDRLVRVDAGDDLFILMRAGDGEDLRIFFGDFPGRRAHAAGDDDAAVFAERVADGLQRFSLGGIEEAARIHDDEVGAFVRIGEAVAVGAELGHDAFGIDQSLGTAEGNQSYFRSGRGL